MRISNNDSDNEYQEETICDPTMVDMETCEKTLHRTTVLFLTLTM